MAEAIHLCGRRDSIDRVPNTFTSLDDSIQPPGDDALLLLGTDAFAEEHTTGSDADVSTGRSWLLAACTSARRRADRQTRRVSSISRRRGHRGRRERCRR